jgi:hypothetical protein
MGIGRVQRRERRVAIAGSSCGSTLECHHDHLRLDDFYVPALTLKEPPGQTFARLLRGL